MNEILMFESLAALQNVASSLLDAGKFYQTAGYYNSHSGGGSLYRWDPTSMAADDDAFIVKHITTPPIVPPPAGRFIYIYDGFVNVKQAGAYGTGIDDTMHDDTAAIIKADNYLNNLPLAFKYGDLCFPSGIYMVSGLIRQNPRINWYAEGRGSVIIKLRGGSNTDVITIKNIAFLSGLVDIVIDGNYGTGDTQNTAGNGIVFESTTGAGGYNHNLYRNKGITGSSNYSNATLRNVIVSNCAENGVVINGANYFVDIDDLYIENCQKNGLYNLSTDNKGFGKITIEACGLSGILEEGSNNRWGPIKTIFNGFNDQDNSAGLKINNSHRSLFTSVEAQDNYCDGFQITNSTSMNLSNFLADGNGYISPANRLSSRRYVGFRFKNSSDITTTGCFATNYLNKRSDGFYIQESSYVIDKDCYDIDVSGITPGNYTNTRNVGVISGIPSYNVSAISCIRPNEYTKDGRTFAVDEPIIDGQGLTITAADNLKYAVQFNPKTNFSFLMDFNATTGSSLGTPTIVASDNNLFAIQFSATSSPQAFNFSIHVNSVLQHVYVPFTTANPTLPLGTSVRVGFKASITPSSTLNLYGSVSWPDPTTGNMIVMSASNNGISVNGTFDPIDNLTLLSQGGANRIPGVVSNVLLTKSSINAFDMQVGGDLFKYVDAADYYTNFINYIPNKALNYVFDTLPAASKYYRGHIFKIQAGIADDNVFECVYRYGTYSWITYYSTIESDQRYIQGFISGSTASTISKADLNADFPTVLKSFMATYPYLTTGAVTAIKLDNSSTGDWLLIHGVLAV